MVAKKIVVDVDRNSILTTWVSCIFLALIPTASVRAASIGSMTNSFSAGSTISASQMNANFNQLLAELNAKETRMGTIEGYFSSGIVPLTNGGTGAGTAATARSNLGLGTSATLDVGITANKVLQLDGSAKLPAVDGSQLTNLQLGTAAPPLDANHVYAWDGNEAAAAGPSGGLSIADSVANATMTLGGNFWVTGDGSLFRGYNNIIQVNGAGNTDHGYALVTPPTGSHTLEVDFQVLATATATSSSQATIISLWNLSPSRGTYLNWSWNTNGLYAGMVNENGVETNTYWNAVPGGTPAFSQFGAGTKHHVMVTVDVGTHTVSIYIDGILWSYKTDATNVVGHTSTGSWYANLGNGSNAPVHMRFARFRISNIVRNAAYARTQFIALNRN